MPPRESQLHGALVHGLAATAASHWFIYKAVAWYNDKGSDTHYNPPLLPRHVPFCLCLGMTSSACAGYYSWIYNNHATAVASFSVALLTFAGVDIYNWPQPEDTTAVNRFIWLLLTCTANQSLSFATKMIMGAAATTVYLIVSAVSPHYTMEGNFPVIFGSIALVTLIHYESYQHCHKTFDSVAAKNAHTRNRDRFRVHVATALLVGFFAHYVATQMIDKLTRPELSKSASFNIVRAGILGAIGLVAAGAFRHELDTKEELEALVEERAAKIAQQAAKIHQQEDDLRQAGMALKASETAMVITDENRTIQWLNPALQRLTGQLDEGQLLNAAIEDALSPSDEDKAKLCRCFQDAGSAEDEIVVHGKIIHVQVSLSPSSTECDETAGTRYVVVLRDITASRALEEAKRMAQHEALISNAMSEAMETLTHELRTPLQGIMGMTSLILDNNPDKIPKDIKEPLTIVMVSSRLLLTLINNILDVRKCDADMMNEFELGAVPALPALSDAVDFCRPLAAISGVQLKASFADGDTESAIVLSDSLRIQQVGINLVSNAIKYSPTGSTVHVHTSIMSLAKAEKAIEQSLASGERQTAWDGMGNSVSKSNIQVLVVSVRDQGQGIDEKMKEGLFKKFTMLGGSHQRTDNIRIGQPSGTGLGLNLCDKFIHRMKGNIWACNNATANGGLQTAAVAGNPQRGASFSFYLPIHVDESEGSELDTPHDDSSTSLVSPAKMVAAPFVFADFTGLIAPFCSSTSDLRILGVDDTLINLKVLDKMLKLIGVGTIRLAKSGEEALQILQEEEFDLVITDLQMPGGMSGTELSAAIRDGELDYKPVVVGLTAEFSRGLDRRCAASGMALVLHKPITMEHLKGFINKLLTAVPFPDLQ